MIPKIIHYVWVGGNKKSSLIEKCIKSWKQYAPDYELRFWNEENIPMDHPYVKEMYRQKKWAFVSDYVRFWALEKEGGIYLDTDMELLKPLDSFLENEVFLGRSKSGHASAGIVGTVPHHPFIQKICAFYDTDTLFSTANTSPLIIEKVLHENSFNDVQVYEPKYFYPCDAGEKCTKEKIEYAYATHHWAESWVPFRNTRKFFRKVGLLALLKKLKISKKFSIFGKFPVVRFLQIRDNPAFIWHYFKRLLYYKYISDRYIPLYKKYTFLTPKETLEKLLSERVSFARFSDGEIEQLTGAGIYPPNSDWSQKTSKALRTRITEAMFSTEKNLFIAHTSPNLFLKNKAEAKRDGILHAMWVDTRMLLYRFLSMDTAYGDAHVFIPANNPSLERKALSDFLATKDILVVTGGVAALKHINLGKRTFFLETGKHDAFSKFERIKNEIRNFFEINHLKKEDTLIMASLGPTAGILAFDLSKEGFHVWDTGHFFKFIDEHTHKDAHRALVK